MISQTWFTALSPQPPLLLHILQGNKPATTNVISSNCA